MLPHPALHPVFEALGYTGGYALYRVQRSRTGDTLSDDHCWWIIAAVAVGALLGSRIFGLLEYAPARGFHPQQLFAFTGGGNLFYRDHLEQSRLAPLRAARASIPADIIASPS